jgi:hypothetical protein
MRKLIVAATAIAAVAVPTIAPVMASATSPANQTFSVGTHSAGHPDTMDSGAVWAYDNLNLKYVVTPAVPGSTTQWNVAITSQGSFAGVLNPYTGAPDINNGSTNGSISYTVTSKTPPNMALVPSQEAPGTSIRLPIAQMFGLGADPSGWSAIGGGDHYTFTYNKVDGAVYQQIA